MSALVVVPLTDKLGSKAIFVFSTSVSVASHVLFPIVANDAITACALRALAGLGLVGVYNPGMRIVAERFANRGARHGGRHIRYLLLRVEQRIADDDGIADGMVRVERRLSDYGRGRRV